MDHTLNLNALRVFAAAARHGNFQRAAEELHISHGAVSQRIKQLELELGVILFQRKPRGVTLTPQGANYRKSVDEALSILAAARSDLDRTSRHITLHLGPSFASKWLMPRLKGFAAQFPHISITTEIHNKAMDRNLGRNEISFWPAQQVNEIPAHHVAHLTELQLVAVCSPNLLRPDWPLDLETLLTFSLLQDAHRRWEHLIEAAGHTKDYSLLNFDRSALALDAAIKGHGVAIAPDFMIEDDLRLGHLVEIWRSPDASGEHLFMSWAKEQGRNTHVMQTVDWVLAEFGLDASD